MTNKSEAISCIVFASKEAGFKCLQFLIEIKEDIRLVLVGSANDKDIIALAEAEGLSVSVFSPGTIASLTDGSLRVDWLLNFWSPHILKPDVLGIATRRLNIHPSLVPHCRGNDSTAWSLRLGSPAGVSLIEMTGEIDAGGVYAQRRIEFDSYEKGRTLHRKLVEASSSLFIDEWKNIRENLSAPREQKGEGSYFTRKMTNRDRIRDETDTMTMDELLHWAGAHDFAPGTTAEVKISDGRRFRIGIEEIRDK